MPDILPRVTQCAEGSLGEEGWEALAEVGGASTSEQSHSAAAVAFGHGRLNALQWLVWPGVPREVEQLIALQCPKVHLNPMPRSLSDAVAKAQAGGPASQQPRRYPTPSGVPPPSSSPVSDAASGLQRPPGETSPSKEEVASSRWDPLDPMCALDEPWAARAGAAAWAGLRSGAASATPLALGGASLAARFRQAYIDRAQRLRERECRAAEVLRRRQLRASPVLRALEGWMDEADIER